MASLTQDIAALNANWSAYASAEQESNFERMNTLNWEFREICQRLAEQGMPFEKLAYDRESKVFSLPG